MLWKRGQAATFSVLAAKALRAAEPGAPGRPAVRGSLWGWGGEASFLSSRWSSRPQACLPALGSRLARIDLRRVLEQMVRWALKCLTR